MELPAKHFCFLSVHFLMLQCTVWKGEWSHQRCLPILLSPFLISTIRVMWIFLQKKYLCMFSDWFPSKIISLWSRFLLCLVTFETVQLCLIAASISRHSVQRESRGFVELRESQACAGQRTRRFSPVGQTAWWQSTWRHTGVSIWWFLFSIQVTVLPLLQKYDTA